MSKKIKEEEIKKEDEKALENRCPSCKASLSYNPKVKKWKCSYCSSEFTLEELQKYSDNASGEEKNKKEEKDTYNKYVNYHCDSCGAEIIADEDTSATFCVYCGNTAILQSKVAGKFAPDLIIPFQTEKNQAIEAFKGLSKGRPLMPKTFNNVENIEKIKGVYIPFWLYNIKVDGEIVMDAKIIKSWTSGDTHYTKTDTYLVTRGGNMSFDRIPVDASTHFDNDIMNSIEPFNFNELTTYNHAYLSGFYAEKYDQESEEVIEEASKRAVNTATTTLENDIKLYTSHVITSNSLSPTELKHQYALLPVWMVNVKFQGKMHIFAMNGQTGEFIGNIPLDKGKTIIYTVIIFLISLIVFIGISYLIFKIGG